MDLDFKTFIPAITFTTGFILGTTFFGLIVHEGGQAIALLAFKIPFHYSLTQATPLVPVTGIADVVVGLSGGAAEALAALLAYWLATVLEKRGEYWFLAAIGLEIAFMSMVFMGVVNSVWEGFFRDSYLTIYHNSATTAVLYFVCILLSYYLVNRHVSKMPIKAVVVY